jgi:hypothetical protein
MHANLVALKGTNLITSSQHASNLTTFGTLIAAFMAIAVTTVVTFSARSRIKRRR